MFIPSKHNSAYEFEKVHVNQGNIELYKVTLEDFDPDIVAIHAPYYLTIKNHLKSLNKYRIPIVAWIHGTETLLQAFHHYFAPWDIRSKLNRIIRDPLRIALLRYLILKSNGVVYVSRWMKTYAERYLLFKHPFSVVIPNPVDTELFSFQRKNREMAREGLAVRGLGWKYGLDIAIRAYSNLKKHI